MDRNALYGVVGAQDTPSAELVEHELPVAVEATLLPYGDTIVVADLNICNGDEGPVLGRSSRSDIEYEFKQIKDVRGITETLDPQTQEAQPSPAAAAAEQRLRMFLKSAATRDQHAADIQKDPQQAPRATGRLHADVVQD